MVNNNTVLILGAGASIHYGYPLGSQLKNQILERAHISIDWRDTRIVMKAVQENADLNKTGLDIIRFLHFNCGFDFEHIQSFERDFSISPRSSIDAFLENRPEFLELGKTLISICILNCEHPGALHGGWYQYLFNIIAPTWERLEDNRVTIVTYNYDRSLEAFFIRALMATFGKSREECIQAFSRCVRIIHVHGSVGGAPDDINDRAYDGTLSVPYIKRAASRLKIIHEEHMLGESYGLVHSVLTDAERIFVLGFGFDQRNLERLRLSDYKAPVYATRNGISDLNINHINELAKDSILFSRKQEYGIIDFFDNEVSLYGFVSEQMPVKDTVAKTILTGVKGVVSKML